ncbi:hypothetical protein O181_103852 [Austropuccinia psidii MF-1]|uniref:Uncharacterized protein n=1 Tax=Austropuccinia psidii MF-1 TaxID=1389203 RepID=A0A9Q3JLY1_9BASI|nr:hypothetical protein [Austropuccinia psidii MF-1]
MSQLFRSPLSPLENNSHGDFRPTHPIKIRESRGCGNVFTHLETINSKIVQPSRTRKKPDDEILKSRQAPFTLYPIQLKVLEVYYRSYERCKGDIRSPGEW